MLQRKWNTFTPVMQYHNFFKIEYFMLLKLFEFDARNLIT